MVPSTLLVSLVKSAGCQLGCILHPAFGTSLVQLPTNMPRTRRAQKQQQTICGLFCGLSRVSALHRHRLKHNQPGCKPLERARQRTCTLHCCRKVSFQGGKLSFWRWTAQAPRLLACRHSSARAVGAFECRAAHTCSHSGGHPSGQQGGRGPPGTSCVHGATLHLWRHSCATAAGACLTKPVSCGTVCCMMGANIKSLTRVGLLTRLLCQSGLRQQSCDPGCSRSGQP